MADQFMWKPRGVWPWLWAAWFLLFFAIEIPALRNDQGGDTLTEQVQFLGGWSPWLFVAGFLIFLGWLTSHFIGRNSRIWRWGPERNKENPDG